MKVDRLTVKQCCKRSALSFKIGGSVSRDFLTYLVGKDFVESNHFTKSGILYVENNAIVVTGTFGQNILNIKCKIDDCAVFVNDFEKLITDMG
jgi:hypothetical protein